MTCLLQTKSLVKTEKDPFNSQVDNFSVLNRTNCVYVHIGRPCMHLIHMRLNILPSNVDVQTLTIHLQMSGIYICSIPPTLIFSVITESSICY